MAYKLRFLFGLMDSLPAKIRSSFRDKSQGRNLESQILGTLSLFAALTCALFFTMNFYTNQSVLVGVALLFSVFLFLSFYYLFRFKGLSRIMIWPFILLIFSCLVVSWFYNQGFGGSTPYFLLASLPVMIFAIDNRKYGLFFLVLILLSITLFLIQLFYPESVFWYSSMRNMLIDKAIGFLIAVSFLGYSLIFLKNEYGKAMKRIERRKEELQDSESRFRDVVLMSGEWIWEIDSKGYFLFSSEKAEDIFGLSPSEMLNHNIFDFLSKEHMLTMLPFLKQLQTEPKPFKKKELWHWNKDGNLICLHSSGMPIFEKDGSLKGFRGVSVDVTLSKTEEESNYWKQYFLDALMDNIPDAIYFKDKDSRFLRINKALAMLFGLGDPDEAIGKTDADYFDLEHAAETYRDEKEIIRTRNPIIGKEELEVWAGKPSSWVSTTKMPLCDSSGNVIGTFGISRNIEESKRMRDVIEKRILALTRPMTKDDPISFEELFDLNGLQTIQDQFSDVAGVASIITKTDGTPITNPSNFTRFCTDLVRGCELGLTNCMKSDAYLGSPNPTGPKVSKCLSSGLWDAGASIFIGDNHVANWLVGQVRDESQSEEAIRIYARKIGLDEDNLVEAFYEVPAMSKDHFEVVARTMYSLANHLSMSAYQNLQQARFITELKQAENALKGNEKELKELNATKDKFFSIIAHDLKSPFNGILGFSDLLQMQLETQNVESAKEYCRVLQQTAKNTMELLDNLLDWARTQSKKMDFNPDEIDLRVLVRETFELFQFSAMQRNIRFIIDEPSHVSVFADKPMLSTVLRNLTSNALKFTPSDGKVSISIKDQGNNWLVSVGDNGIGMSSELLSDLFRIDTNRRTVGLNGERGTGLGLILCKEFVEKHGGTIFADSELGKGSTIYFTLPKIKKI
jgi:PAS domain S-box-containing protein